MDNKDRKARVVYWENDGKYIDVSYTQEDGQRVEATFKRVAWRTPPADVLARVNKALNKGPIYIAGRLGRPSS
jgi:hypothetical protein